MNATVTVVELDHVRLGQRHRALDQAFELANIAILAHPRIALFHFAADVTGDRPCFDYRLREGASEQRLGMTLLRQEGVLDRLERSAESVTAQRAVSATSI